ncbi:MAG: hypothetical protein J6V74_02910 [Bacteroidales bacterium]|nr:hypothetical protein [Bacteroidales bacterium]
MELLENKSGLEDLWAESLKFIKDNLGDDNIQSYKTWFEPIQALSWEDNTLTLQVPSDFYREYIEENYIDLLRSVLHKFFGANASLQYGVLVKRNVPDKKIASRIETTTKKNTQAYAPVNQYSPNKEIKDPFIIPGVKSTIVNFGKIIWKRNL